MRLLLSPSNCPLFWSRCFWEISGEKVNRPMLSFVLNSSVTSRSARFAFHMRLAGSSPPTG